jgi:predicted NBD/HSP70 family sugar kinase
MVVDKHTIRKTNQSMILENIICNQPISRATLSKETNLNKATVSQITKELLEADLILEIGEGNSTSVGGRKPTMLKLNGEAGVSISIDLGANYIAVALFYINGKLIYEHITRDIEINKDNVISYILKAVKRVEKVKVNTVYGITGIGIAIHGITYKDKIIFTSYYDLDKMDLTAQLKDYFKYPIYIENEANLSALAESTFTSQHKNLVCLSVHSGIGVGIINNGELYSGQNGMAGEIGHTILIPDGDLCRCGNHGCLELYCSEVSILNQYQKQAKKEEMVTSDSFCAAYHANDQIAVQLVEKMSKFLAIALNNIVVSYSPEIIYMNSPIIRRIPQMIEMITNRLESSFSKGVVVVNSNLGAKAILHGACALCTRHFLNVKHIKLTSVFTNEKTNIN